jgi:hypothetical protein
VNDDERDDQAAEVIPQVPAEPAPARIEIHGPIGRPGK